MAVRPEVIGDVEEGEPTPGARDEMGLTPDERAEWDAMASAKDAAPVETEADTPIEEKPLAAKPEGDAPAAEDAPPEGEDDGEEVAEGAPAVDPKTGRAPQKQVNWNKHQRELKKREDKIAAAETQLRQEREDRIKLAERLNILNEALTAPAPVDPVKAQEAAIAANPMLEPDIDVSVDALGAIVQGQRRIAFLQKEGAQKYEVTQATLEDRELKDEFQRDTEMFARTEEGRHFWPAYQYLKDSRLTELAISLYDKDPNDPTQVFTQAEITRLVNDFNAEEKWVVSNARAARKSPSAAIMKLAKGRGFNPQAAAPAAAAPAAVALAAPTKNGNGSAPVASAVAKIIAEAEGAAASRSLSDGGGAPPAAALTMERLLAMGQDEFAAYVDNFPAQVSAIMGKSLEGRP